MTLIESKKGIEFSKEIKLIEAGLVSIPKYKVNYFEPSQKKIYIRDCREKWGGYQVIIPIKSCKQVQTNLVELKEFFNCRGRGNAVSRFKTLSRSAVEKLSLHGEIDIDFDLFSANAEIWITPNKQEPLEYKEVEELNNDKLNEKTIEWERGKVSLSDMATMIEEAGRLYRKSKKKGPRKRLVMPSHGKLLKGPGKLDIRIPTSALRNEIGHYNRLTLYFLSSLASAMSLNVPYDPLSLLSKSIQMTFVPKEQWISFSDVGGYKELKRELKTTYLGKYEEEEKFEKLHLSMRHYLFAGMAGTGKSMMLAAIINEFSGSSNVIPFHRLFSSQKQEFAAIFNFISSLSEKTGRPTLLIYDEIDDVGFARENWSSKGNNDLLRSLDGVLEHNVSMIAATNRPHVLDPALLRPGRLSPIVIFAPPNEKSRKEILNIHLG
ncbi:MAG: AAA family ATPase, partial [Candidatus Hodarchaeales archaeon]